MGTRGRHEEFGGGPLGRWLLALSLEANYGRRLAHRVVTRAVVALKWSSIGRLVINGARPDRIKGELASDRAQIWTWRKESPSDKCGCGRDALVAGSCCELSKSICLVSRGGQFERLASSEVARLANAPGRRWELASGANPTLALVIN